MHKHCLQYEGWMIGAFGCALDMPAEWDLSIVVPVFNGKAGIMNYSSHRAGKLLEHSMEVVGRTVWTYGL